MQHGKVLRTLYSTLQAKAKAKAKAKAVSWCNRTCTLWSNSSTHPNIHWLPWPWSALGMAFWSTFVLPTEVDEFLSKDNFF